MTWEEMYKAAMQELHKSLIGHDGTYIHTGGSSRENASQWAMIALALRQQLY